jgi:hypothetical protein
VHNPTPLKMRVQPQSDNPDFLPVETEVELAPGETRKIKVLFRPKETSGVQVGKLTLYQLSEGGDVNALTEIVNVQWQKNTGKGSSNNVLNTQDDVVFEGRGGKFGFNVSGDVETLAENIPEMDPKLDNVQLSKIQMRFNRIATGKTVRKMFEVENSGDTILEFATYDLDHEAIDDETTYHSKNGFFNYTISPSVSRIMPKTKEKVMVVLEAKKDGTDEFGFFVKTKNLIRNKVVQVQVSATIYTPTDMDNLRAFVRADDNLETKYDLKAQEERYAMTDLHLWKVLSPIVRISSKKASEEMVYIQPVQPNVSRVEIGPFVVRPPAIPETQAPKNKKWYTNRISMAVDKLNKEVDMPRPSEEKREQMIQFLARSKVEKNVVLDKKNK